MGPPPPSCHITTLVQTLTTLRRTFYTPHHYPKFLFGFMTLSGICGYYTMEYWYNKSLTARDAVYSEAYHCGGEMITENEGRLTAMAKRLTQRLATTTTATAVTPSTTTTIGLQRQVTKFW